MIEVKFKIVSTGEKDRYIRIKNPTKKGYNALCAQARIIAEKFRVDIEEPITIIYTNAEPSNVKFKEKNTKDISVKNNQLHLFN